MSKESRIEFLSGGVLVGPVEATPPVSVEIGQLFFVSSNTSYGFSPDGVAIVYLVHEISAGIGVNVTPSGGLVDVEVDFTEVMRLSTDQTVAGTKTFSGEIILPSSAGVPTGPGTVSRIKYDTVNKDLYVDDGTSWSVVGSLQTINANGGLTGGGAGASVDLDVDPGDGIAVSGGKVVVSLASDPGLEFSSGGLRTKIDSATAPSTTASVVKRNSNGLAVGVDGVTITATAAGGNLQLADGSVTDAKLAESAKTAALAKRIFPTRSSVTFTFDTDTPIDYIPTIRALQATATAVTSLTSEGIYTGIDSSLELPLRVNLEFKPIAASAQGKIGESVMCRLSSKGLLEDSSSISGITVLKAGPQAVTSASLTYNPGTGIIQWNGGTNYSPSLSETSYLKVEGSSSEDYLFIEVVGPSLPVAGLLQSTTISMASFFPLAQPVNITGVTINGMQSGVPASASLSYTSAGTLLAWNGGTGVNVGAGGDFVLLGSAGSTDRIAVTVSAGSLPGSNQSDTINRGSFFEFLFYYFDDEDDVEVPVTELEGGSNVSVSASVIHMSTFDSVSAKGAIADGYQRVFSNLKKFVSPSLSGISWSQTNPFGSKYIQVQAFLTSGEEIPESDMNTPPTISDATIEYDFTGIKSGYIVAVG